MRELVEKLIRDDPKFHSGGVSNWNALGEILLALDSLADAATHSVETGCGASTVVFAAAGGQHTTISPDEREHQLVKKYCDDNGIAHSQVTFLASSSTEVLPTLYDGRVLDLAFIDGAHGFPYAIVDWHYISQSLKVGGRVLVDDIAIPAIAPLFKFMNTEESWRLVSLPDDRAALFQLDAEPPPEDYTTQVFNRHMDYSFASPATRARFTANATLSRIRQQAARRMPWLRDAFHRAKGTR